MSDDLHALTGAYVMDALDPDERAEFERFMASSPSVAAEVDSLREAVAALGGAVSETPPAGMRGAVLDRVDNARQERPVVPITEAPSVRTSGTAAPRSWLVAISAVAAAAAVTVSIFLGVGLSQLNTKVDRLEETAGQVAAVVTADDARQARVALPDGGVLASVVSDTYGVGVAVASGLSALDSNLMYALWGLSSGVPVPIGELVNGEPLPIDAASYQSLGVTVEPRGELVAPTSAVIATLPA